MRQGLSANRTVESLWINCMAMTVMIFLASWPQGSPASQIDTESWIGREIAEFGLKFKLPRKYNEKHWEVTVGSIEGRRFFAGVAFVDFEVEERTTFDIAKTRRQLNHDDFKEWTDQIRGHKALVQS